MFDLDGVSLLVHGISSTYTENGKTKRKMGVFTRSFSCLAGWFGLVCLAWLGSDIFVSFSTN